MARLSLVLVAMVGAGAIAIQLVPYGREHTNPPVRQEPAWDSPLTRELSVRACFACHSNQTEWPWYSNVAPASWLVQRDVDEGRQKLNFSEFDRVQREARESAEKVEEGEMPPRAYLLAHPQAVLSAGDKQAMVGGLSATLGEPERGRGRGPESERESAQQLSLLPLSGAEIARVENAPEAAAVVGGGAAARLPRNREDIRSDAMLVSREHKRASVRFGGEPMARAVGRRVLHVGTDDGVFTSEVDDDAGRACLLSAGLRGSPIRGIAVAPSDSSIVLCGCGGPGAGLYHSRDGGLTWEAPGRWPLDCEAWALSFSPHDPRVVLAGTEPPRIYRSGDLGYTWDELPGIEAAPGREFWTFPHPPHRAHIRQIAVDPLHTRTLLAAVEVGGVLQSDDGGQRWRPISQGVDLDAHALTFWPVDPQVALAATGGGLFRLSQRKGKWQRVPSAALGTYVVALATSAKARAIFVATRGGKGPVCRSDDGGATWQALGSDLPQPAYGVDALAMQDDEPAAIYYGAQDTDDPGQGCLFASYDAGATWRKLRLEFALPRVTRLAACTVASPRC